jgi:hypothetical protein
VTPCTLKEIELGWPKYFEGSTCLRIIVKCLHHYAPTFDNDGNIYTKKWLYLKIIFISWDDLGIVLTFQRVNRNRWVKQRYETAYLFVVWMIYFAYYQILRTVRRHYIVGQGKGKGHPGTIHEDPDGELRYSSTLSLNSALVGVGGQSHAPATLPSGKTRYPLYRGLVGPRAGLDGCGKSRPHRISIPGPSSP